VRDTGVPDLCGFLKRFHKKSQDIFINLNEIHILKNKVPYITGGG
jgi:hypothetical protein